MDISYVNIQYFVDILWLNHDDIVELNQNIDLLPCDTQKEVNYIIWYRIHEIRIVY